ncbi:hypothetical protein [Staphylococcus equorum]|uniref:Uncharacterized protein n=1 Tax=Staphylococcus equorum TaxID=246432 RepID=A0AAP7LV11_9STAP|nr:hypothetical protein [Staphylococcus equorum]OEK58894.1 hypothetical protein ASS94_00805 [Staphylococcus equorum]
MLLLFIVMSFIWVLCFFIMLSYVNLHVLKKWNDKDTFLQKRNRRIKSFLLEDEKLNGRRMFVVIIGATIITAITFTILCFLVFASQQGVVSTFIVTLIISAIVYWIGSKFIKSLAYQLFEKDN